MNQLELTSQSIRYTTKNCIPQTAWLIPRCLLLFDTLNRLYCNNMQKKIGNCHCRKVTYQVEIDLMRPVIECNCSHCQIKGLLLSFIPEKSFTLTDGKDAQTEYRFNTNKIHFLLRLIIFWLLYFAMFRVVFIIYHHQHFLFSRTTTNQMILLFLKNCSL